MRTQFAWRGEYSEAVARREDRSLRERSSPKDSRNDSAGRRDRDRDRELSSPWSDIAQEQDCLGVGLADLIE